MENDSSCLILQRSSSNTVQHIQRKTPLVAMDKHIHGVSNTALAKPKDTAEQKDAAEEQGSSHSFAVADESDRHHHHYHSQQKQQDRMQLVDALNTALEKETLRSEREEERGNETAVGEEQDVSLTQHESISRNEAIEFEVSRLTLRNKRILLSRLREIAPVGRLEVINLSRRGLGVDDAKPIAEAIQRNPCLSVLKLSYNDLGDEGATVIASAFLQSGKHHAKLSVLDFGFNSIGDVGCQAIAAHAVAGNFVLQTLYLSGNQIGVKGALSIAGAILQGSGLLCLHLTANSIEPMGIKAIAGAIAENDAKVSTVRRRDNVATTPEILPSMRELHLASSGIGSDGFFAIPGMLVSNLSLQTLNISGIGIFDKDIVLLAQALTQNKLIPLVALDLSFNEITCQGVEYLMNAVWGSETLRSIKLDNNKIRDRGTQLCAVVLTSIALEALDLSFNRHITTTGIKALMKNISENNSLRSLGLCGVPMDQNSSKAISYALAYNTSLKAVYLDNSTTGYSSQRHIVAGIISNQNSSLRVFTGFDICPIAMTLGMPRLPEHWSNDQVLGFIRFMWQQWLLKSGRGSAPADDGTRGPAPPSAVAAAAKIAFSALGSAPYEMFRTELHEKPPAEQPPVDKSEASFLERSQSGTIVVPDFSGSADGDVSEWAEENRTSGSSTPGSPSTVISPLENPERRNRNLQWLRLHFRSVSDIGRLPFNNADLWQLHQYYFSPPYQTIPGTESSRDDAVNDSDSSKSSPGALAGVAPPPTPALGPRSNSTIGRAVSYQALGDALAASDLSAHGHKRPPDDDASESSKPAAKRTKRLQPRIAYYPRIMDKVQGMGTKPMELTLSLLRQLKYVESIMFADRNPYSEPCSNDSEEHTHTDVEMVLLDLL